MELVATLRDGKYSGLIKLGVPSGHGVFLYTNGEKLDVRWNALHIQIGIYSYKWRPIRRQLAAGQAWDRNLLCEWLQYRGVQ